MLLGCVCGGGGGGQRSVAWHGLIVRERVVPLLGGHTGGPVHYIEVVLPQARRASFDSIEMFLASFSSNSPKVVAVFAGETPRGTLRKVSGWWLCIASQGTPP